MVARTLEARLIARLLALAAVGLILAGATTALVADRALSASERSRTLAIAAGARKALAVELAEGDRPDEAAQEVLASAEGQGVRLTIRDANQGGSVYSTGAATLPRIAPGSCEDLEDGDPWLSCADSDTSLSVVAAIPVFEHRAAMVAAQRALVALVLFAGAALWWAIRRALRAPLGELAALVAWTEHARKGEPAERPPPATTREIAKLSAAFDALVRDLVATLARERATSAYIAHELRTPLTAVVAEVDALASRDPSTRAAVSRIRSDATRLADVIDAVLVLSSRDRGGPSEIVNVADIARELAPAEATIDAPDEALVKADERLIRLALRNLLDNASKYAGGARVVRVSRLPDGVRLGVVDEGAGLDEAARDKMFERYWRRSGDGNGRGLGLALVRAVAERHGGRAVAVPGPEGRGLDVSLTLGHLVDWHT
jgi:signal transduction histidine kinase